MKINKFKIRFLSGCKQLVKKPWKLIFPIAIFALYVTLHIFSNQIPINAVFPKQLQGIAPYILVSMYTIVCIVLFLFVLEKLGTPALAVRTENALMAVFTARDLRSGCPMLISVERIKGTQKVVRMEFFSKGIPLKRWLELTPEIEDILNIHLLEPLQYGGRDGSNRHFIVLIASRGAKPLERGVLYDEK